VPRSRHAVSARDVDSSVLIIESALSSITQPAVTFPISLSELSRFAAGAFQRHFGLSRGCLTTKSAVVLQQNGQTI
jgi:hypothetical protein